MKNNYLLLTTITLSLLAGQISAAPPHAHQETGVVETYKTDSCRKAHEMHRDRLKQKAAEHCETVHNSILDRFRYRAEGCDFIKQGEPPTLVIGGYRFSCK